MLSEFRVANVAGEPMKVLVLAATSRFVLVENEDLEALSRKRATVRSLAFAEAAASNVACARITRHRHREMCGRGGAFTSADRGALGLQRRAVGRKRTQPVEKIVRNRFE